MSTFQLKTVLILFTVCTSLLCDSENISTSDGYTATVNSSSSTLLPDMCQIDNLLSHQVNVSQTYTHLCHLQFLKAFKFNGTTEVLLFVSIFNSGKSKQADVNFIDQLADQLDSGNMQYQLVIRVNNETDEDVSVSVNVNNVSYSFLTTPEKREELISEQFNKESLSNTSFSVLLDGNSTKVNISTSYAVLCLRMENDFLDSKTNCSVDSEGEDLFCYCVSRLENRDAFLLLLFTFAIFWITVLFTLAYKWLFEEEEEEGQPAPEVQLNLVLCSMTTWTHQYLIIFRLGPPSDGFHFHKDGYIDMQLLTGKDEEMGMPVRYKAPFLSDPSMTSTAEMHMIVFSRIPLGRVSGLKANHSVPGSYLLLINMTVFELEKGNSIIQEETFRQYIYNEMSVLRPLSDSKAIPNILPDHRLPITSLRLTRQEKMAYCLFAFCFTSVHTMVYLHLYQNWKVVGLTMTLFSLYAFLLSIFTCGLLGSVEAVYLKYIKTPFLLNNQNLLSSPQATRFNLSWISRCVYLGALYLLSFAMSIAAILLSKSMDIQSGVLWTGMTNLVFVCSIGLWLLLEEIFMLQIKLKRAKEDYSSRVDSGAESSHSKSMIYFSTKDSNKNKSSAFSKMAYPSSDGPKLYNPKRFHLVDTDGGTGDSLKVSTVEVKSLCPAYSHFMSTHKSRTMSNTSQMIHKVNCQPKHQMSGQLTPKPPQIDSRHCKGQASLVHSLNVSSLSKLKTFK